MRKSPRSWHWYPLVLCEGLTEKQLHWQPDANPKRITFRGPPGLLGAPL